MNEFYVGYVPKAPANIASYIKRAVIIALSATAAIAITLVIGQHKFDPSKFEFGVFRPYEGIVETGPVLVSNGQAYVLVAPGKHGIAVPPGMHARLRGSLAANGQDRVLEVEPGSLQILQPQSAATPLGQRTYEGEIVDTKCYFGVMNPGRGVVHRDCAARCISGGIPAGLLVRDANGNLRTILLTGMPNNTLVRYAGQKVRISGTLSQIGDALQLKIERME